MLQPGDFFLVRDVSPIIALREMKISEVISTQTKVLYLFQTIGSMILPLSGYVRFSSFKTLIEFSV